MGEVSEVVVVSNEPTPAVQPPAVQKEPEATTAVDPRDYFKITLFQKKAEGIDADKSHPWNMVIDGGDLWAEDEYGIVAVGETFDNNGTGPNRRGVLIAENSGDESGSLYLQGLSQEQKVDLIEAITNFTFRLIPESRHIFIRKLIDQAPHLVGDEAFAAKLATLGLELLPDDPKGVEQTSFNFPQIETASDIQSTEISRFLSLISHKLPAEKLAEKIKQLTSNYELPDDPFGRNYSYLFSIMERWVLDERPDTQINNNLQRKFEPIKFSTKDKVGRPINSIDALKTILEELPVEAEPYTGGMRWGETNAELVSIDKVMGGVGIKDWSDIPSNRGLPKVFTFARGFQDDSIDVVGNDRPIKIIEISGKYFITGDGRHRVAALKALAVHQAPMLVTHLSW